MIGIASGLQHNETYAYRTKTSVLKMVTVERKNVSLDGATESLLLCTGTIYL